MPGKQATAVGVRTRPPRAQNKFDIEHYRIRDASEVRLNLWEDLFGRMQEALSSSLGFEWKRKRGEGGPQGGQLHKEVLRC
jgi:hypothetical protein